MNRQLSAYVELTRPKNAIMSMLGTLVGWLTVSTTMNCNLLLAIMVPPLVLAGGNAINDYFDVDIDLVNRPHRPIPSGRISRRDALQVYVILSSSGVCISLLLGFIQFTLAFIFSVAWYAYGRWIKRTGLPGNMLVSAGVACTLIFGGVTAGTPNLRLALYTLIAFSVNLMREIVKDVEDIPGDLAVGLRTLPIRAGSRKTGVFLFALGVLSAVLSLLPIVLGLVGLLYKAIIAPALILLVASAIYGLRVNQEFAGKLSGMLKIAMLLGLLAMMSDPLAAGFIWR